MKMAPTTLIQLFIRDTHTATDIGIDFIRIIEFNQLLCPFSYKYIVSFANMKMQFYPFLLKQRYAHV